MKLDSADRKILVVAGSVLGITLLISLAVSPSAEESVPYPSTFSAASDGAKAAYTLLPELGYQVEHWRKAPSKLLEHGVQTVLVVNVLTENPTVEDRESLERYVQSGGKMLAVGMSSTQLIPHSELFPDVPHFAWQTYRALIPSGVTSNAPEIVMAPTVYWRRSDYDSDVQYGDRDRGVVVSYRYGKGEVIWWATPDPLTNSGITQKNNLQLLLNSLGPAGERTVLWDDYFHEGEATMMDSLFASPLKWSLPQLGLLALVVILTYSRRHGPIRPLPQVSRLATLEFVDTLGALYQRVGATELPVQVAYERFRHLLQRKLGIGSSATAQQIANRLQDRLGELAPQFEHTLLACESVGYQPEIEQQEALRLVKSLDLFARQLKLSSKGEEAK